MESGATWSRSWGFALSETHEERPLAGVTLLELNRAGSPLCLRIANAFATRIAADLGATVVKLEPFGGDPVRHCAPLLAARAGAPRASALFEFLNCGKSILRMPQAPEETLDRLLAGKVDGVLAEEGDAALALARARGIAAVEITGFPGTASGEHPPLSEFTALAASGMLDIIGDPAREPLRLGGHQAAYAAGMSAFTAMGALLTGQEAGLPARYAKISLIETLLWVNWKTVSATQAMGRSPTRKGARAEFPVFACADGWVALVYPANDYAAVLRLINDPVLAEPRFATAAGRAEHGTEWSARVAAWFAGRTRQDIYAQAQGLGVPLGPVLDAADLLDDVQHKARGFVTTMAHPVHGSLRMPRLPVLFGNRGLDPAPWTLAKTGGAMRQEGGS